MRRNYGLDLCRMLSMTGIVILHIIGVGGVLENAIQVDCKYLIKWVQLILYCSVDIFGIMAGYFGLYKTKNSCYRAIELIVITLFYSIIISILFAITPSNESLGLKEFIKGLFPPIIGRYWFITCFIPVLLLQPYVNKMLKALSLIQLRSLCILIILAFSIIPSLANHDFFVFDGGYSFAWLMCCYVLGAYLRAKESERNVNNKNMMVLCFVVLVACSVGIIGINVLLSNIIRAESQYLISYTSPFVLALSVFVFYAFSRTNVKEHSWIPVVSSMMFDVYIIHAHYFIYEKLINGSFSWIARMPLLSIPFILGVSGLIITCACIMFALLRNRVFKALHISDAILKSSARIDSVLYKGLSDC